MTNPPEFEQLDNGLWQGSVQDAYDDTIHIGDSSLAYPAGMRISKAGTDQSFLITQPTVDALLPTFLRFAVSGTVSPQKAVDHDMAKAILLSAYHLICSDDASNDPKLAGIRYALNLALDISMRSAEPRSILASFGEPDKRTTKWLIKFEDAEVGDMMFDGALYGDAEAELLAREAYAKHSVNWNCTLFQVAQANPAGAIMIETQQATDDRQTLFDEGIRLLELLRKANDEIRSLSGADVRPLITEIAIATGEIPPEYGPAHKIVDAWRRGFPKAHKAARQAAAKAVRDKEQHLDYVRRNGNIYENEKDEAEYLSNLDQMVEETAYELAACDATTKPLETDPLSLLLPIGTVVRVSEIKSKTLYYTPIAGSIGVVVGYRPRETRPLLVAFPSDIRDTGGGTIQFNEDRPQQFYYRRDEVDIAEHSKLVGSDHENLMVGFIPTHMHDDESSPQDREDMLFEALGWTWRIQEINGVPERTQMHKKTGYFLEWMKPIEGNAA